jgi:hypothetical protein
MKDIHKLIACSKPGVEGSLNCIECLETFEEWTELREHFDRLHEPVSVFFERHLWIYQNKIIEIQ